MLSFLQILIKALIVTMDGGGEELENEDYTTTCFTIYEGQGNNIKLLKRFPFKVNIGGFWSNITKHTYGYSSGPPIGNQCGTVMAMSAYAKEPDKYLEVMTKALRASDYSKFSEWAPLDFDEKLNIAAALQTATEAYVKELIKPYADKIGTNNLCLAGGVALNSVMTGRMFDWYDKQFNNIYVCPVPYDAGLAIGCAQYIWHCIEDQPRQFTNKNFTPYLGKKYPIEDVELAIEENNEKITVTKVTDDDVLQKLKDKKIIAVFGGGSESGRRALGNRSILADPYTPGYERYSK